ncbi:antitoxin YezG family protein [Pseudalkalibacillus decolorationis]|uniref:antitoxin YezG family protein n=1 Tax=Pseudalkalibacillus decolorationis TaxID=163879 RepID=UPI002148E52C|nr:antitoxin YezG family protein [Pseudalkalibacillus decolorationis]
MEELYQNIGITLNDMIPEAWGKIALFAEFRSDLKRIFFYYIPSGKTDPVYNLNVPDLYSINEEEYQELEFQLYDYFTELWEEFRNQNQEQWTNLTLTIDNTGDFKIDYNYEDLSEVDSYEQQIIWEYKHLGIKTKGERLQAIIEKYIDDNERT